MKEVWRELFSGIDPLILDCMSMTALFFLLAILSLLYVFS